MIVEVEVDSLEQLAIVLPKQPDIVLLDNMSLDQLREAVVLRDASDVITQLEASGGVNLKTVADIAHTGVDRISVGALTHSATALDVAWTGSRPVPVQPLHFLDALVSHGEPRNRQVSPDCQDSLIRTDVEHGPGSWTPNNGYPTSTCDTT